jgi:hypothetical protein
MQDCAAMKARWPDMLPKFFATLMTTPGNEGCTTGWSSDGATMAFGVNGDRSRHDKRPTRSLRLLREIDVVQLRT